MKIDLHMHSGYSSDGEYAPRDLVQMAHGAGISIIAVADHNRVDGVEEAVRAGGEAGVKVIPAVELDCIHEGTPLHVLGYGIDHKDGRFKKVWQDVERKEIASAAGRLEKVRALGIIVDDDAIAALSPDGIVTGEMIAEAALADPRNGADPILAPFRPGGARSDNPFVNFYWDCCSPGKAAFIPVEYMSLADAVALIAGTGGKAVLAHPGQSLRGKESLFPAIAKQGFFGVEVYSSYHSPEDRLRWKQEAEAMHLAATCGSDFHGKTKPSIRMAAHGADEAAMTRVAEALCR